MLAGYLPFDDDPANPEGDNINLLYKYITTTALTFPEYVTPHARDLLRRILVADPRQRADLFEVARHSWLSDFAHVVAQVTSSTTTVGEIANTTVTAGKASLLHSMFCSRLCSESGCFACQNQADSVFSRSARCSFARPQCFRQRTIQDASVQHVSCWRAQSSRQIRPRASY